MSDKRRAAPGADSIYKDPRNSKKWIGKATVDGKVVRVYGNRTQSEARERLETRKAQVRLGQVEQKERRAKLVVADLLAEWFDRGLLGRGRAPSTIDRHRWAKDHLTRELGEIRVAELKVRDVEDALDRLARGGDPQVHGSTGLSKSSLTQIRNTLTQALKFGQRREDVTRNVARDATLPPGAAPPVERRSLVPDEAQRLLTVLPEVRNGAMFALMLQCGLRPGEARGLFWEDLDLEAGTVNVTRAARDGKGGRAEITDELKTKSAKRTLALPSDLVVALRRHRIEQAAERLAANSWIDERLVFSGRTGDVVSKSKVQDDLADVCSDAQIDPGVKPNELRHSCASYLSDQGASNEVIADVLGHTTTRMVDATYRHRLRPVVDVTATVDWTAGHDAK